MVAVLREADKLLMLLADYGMEMALPKSIPTLEAMATKTGRGRIMSFVATTWGTRLLPAQQILVCVAQAQIMCPS